MAIGIAIAIATVGAGGCPFAGTVIDHPALAPRMAWRQRYALRRP